MRRKRRNRDVGPTRVVAQPLDRGQLTSNGSASRTEGCKRTSAVTAFGPTRVVAQPLGGGRLTSNGSTSEQKAQANKTRKGRLAMQRVG